MNRPVWIAGAASLLLVAVGVALAFGWAWWQGRSGGEGMEDLAFLIGALAISILLAAVAPVVVSLLWHGFSLSRLFAGLIVAGFYVLIAVVLLRNVQILFPQYALGGLLLAGLGLQFLVPWLVARTH